MKKSIRFIGMDVHKKTIDISVAAEGHDGKVWHFANIGGDLTSLDKAIDKLAADGHPLRCVYEAGPCGFVIQRHLAKREIPCIVVAPGQVPKKSSDRIKTDRRDSKTLAVQYRAGALDAIYVPQPEDEAVRDLVRAREDFVHNRRRARQHINSFLLRHGRHYSGKKKWGREHRRWLAEQQFDHPAQRITLEEYIKTLEDAEAHMERITGEVQEQLPAWRLNPYVEALQALRGVSWLVAATVVAEVGDLTRFHPRELMAFLGMIPSEYSSGEKRRQGAITKSGNAHVRRVLCEAAWAYQHKPAITLHLLKRQEQLPKDIRDIAWKAQLRLCRRFALLSAGGKHRNKVNIAIGRELLGFIWDIARCVAGKPSTSRATDSAPREVYVLQRRPKSTTTSAPKTTTTPRQRKTAPKTRKQKAA